MRFKITSPDWEQVLNEVGVKTEEKCEKFLSLGFSARALQGNMSIRDVSQEHLKKLIEYLFLGEELDKECFLSRNPNQDVIYFPDSSLVFKALNPCRSYETVNDCENAYKAHGQGYVNTVIGYDVAQSHRLDDLVVPRTALVFIERLKNNESKQEDPNALYFEVEKPLPGRAFSASLVIPVESVDQNVCEAEIQESHFEVPSKQKSQPDVNEEAVIMLSVMPEIFEPLQERLSDNSKSSASMQKDDHVRKHKVLGGGVGPSQVKVALIFQEKLELMSNPEVQAYCKDHPYSMTTPILHTAHIVCLTHWTNACDRNLSFIRFGDNAPKMALVDLKELSPERSLAIGSEIQETNSEKDKKNLGILAIYGNSFRVGLYNSVPKTYQTWVRLVAENYGIIQETVKT